MNEYDDIADLFANADQLESSEAFAAALRTRIERERRRRRLLAVASVLSAVLIVALGLTTLPVDIAYPLRLLQEFLTSPTGMAACAIVAVALTAWLRIEEAL